MVLRGPQLALGAFAMWPGAAFAHLVSVRFGDFYSGMLHPLTALEHAAAFALIGLLLGLREPVVARLGIVGLPLAIALGVAAGIHGDSDWDLSVVNYLSLVVLGAAVALTRDWHVVSVMVALLGFGLSHGFANGTAFVDGGDAWLFLAGVALSAYLVVTLVAGLCDALKSRGPAMIGMRAVASWIGAVGVMMLGLAVAG